MRKILLIAARDYIAAVRTRTFVISLLFVPTIILAATIIQWVMRQRGDAQLDRYAVIDRTPGQALLPAIEAAARLEPSSEAGTGGETEPREQSSFAIVRIEPGPDTAEAVMRQRLDLSARVRTGEFAGFLEVGPDVLGGVARPGDERTAVRFQSNVLMTNGFTRIVMAAVSEVVQKRRADQLGLAWDKFQIARLPVPFQSVGLSRLDPETGQMTEASEKSRLVSILIPVGLVFLMFMMVFSGSTPLLQSVAEEKGWRIAELLLSSVRPFELMAGKLIGNIGVGLTTVAVYLVAISLPAHRYGYDELITPGLMGWFLLFQVLGVLIYGSMFIAVGAACNDAKQIQTLLMPIMFLAMSPLFVLGAVIQDPQTPLLAWLSFFPFATPMLMVLRLAIPPGVAWWQPAIGAVLMVLAAALCVYVAGRIFRLGLLLQGKGADLRQMLRWALRG
jgi:ABC-2 type transport system permease protein